MTDHKRTMQAISAFDADNGPVSVEITGNGERETVQGMTLAANITNLNPEQLAKLQAHLLKAGQDYRRYFQSLRYKSKGKLRRCYAAICQASESEVMRLAEGVVWSLTKWNFQLIHSPIICGFIDWYQDKTHLDTQNSSGT